MGFFSDLINRFRRKPQQQVRRPMITPDQVDHEDPMGRYVIARAFNTGQTVFVSRNDPKDEPSLLDPNPVTNPVFYPIFYGDQTESSRQDTEPGQTHSHGTHHHHDDGSALSPAEHHGHNHHDGNSYQQDASCEHETHHHQQTFDPPSVSETHHHCDPPTSYDQPAVDTSSVYDSPAIDTSSSIDFGG